eukprot:CAMPEP_0177709988 /NCGR_PEP_ID=MMETSP0484_2-20121128/11094_1 /TAXON_ID=354590 /ORGANISM="Rhodomonas lens, Strain RHODO" /LENGTH=163 /DNA_ID=CAMNT_0019221637 /DNA_START=14 /DNA_END=505 /DNA_ORIENTATION=+
MAILSSSSFATMCAAAGLALLAHPSAAFAPQLGAVASNRPLQTCSASSVVMMASQGPDQLSRRNFLALSSVGAMAAIAQPRFVEAAEPVAMEMDLAAPTEEEDKQRLKKEFQKIKEKEEREKRKKSEPPAWQTGIMKAQEKGRENKKLRKNRDEICEVLGRGC